MSLCSRSARPGPFPHRCGLFRGRHFSPFPTSSEFGVFRRQSPGAIHGPTLALLVDVSLFSPTRRRWSGAGRGAACVSTSASIRRYRPELDRTRRPVYVDRLPPCNHACPAGENVQAWLAEAQAGRYREAWEIIVRDNPLPAVHGRVCYHPCEDACNRKEVDEPVSIHAVERFVGDMALEQGWRSAGRILPPANACWSLAQDRAAFPRHGISPALATRWSSTRPGHSQVA